MVFVHFVVLSTMISKRHLSEPVKFHGAEDPMFSLQC